VRAFTARHPGVEIEVAVQHTGHLVDALLEGAVDVALLTDTVRDKRVRLRTLTSDEHVAIVAKDHPWATRTFITPEELATASLLLYSPSPAESFTVRQILKPAGLRPARVRFVQLTEAILEMVKAGLGVTVMPKWSVRSALEDGELRAVRITRGGMHRDWAAATLEGSGEPPYLTDFLELVRKTIRGLP
jgi:LysR family transcriptional regulator, regulator for metE and metH